MPRLNIRSGRTAAEGIARLVSDAEIRRKAERQPGSVFPVAKVVADAADADPVAQVGKLPPGAIAEFRFHPTRRWRFDYAWPRLRIALEIEGGIWTKGRHTRGSGFLGDMKKYNAATLLGWRVLRCTPQEFKSGAAAELVRRAME